MILYKGDIQFDANIPLSFLISQKLSFIFSSAVSFFIEVSVKVFVKISEVFLIVSVSGSTVVLYFHESSVYLICLVIELVVGDLVTRLTCLNFLTLLGF